MRMTQKILSIIFITIVLLFSKQDWVFADTIQDNNQDAVYDNFDKDNITSCGNGMLKDIPALLPKVISTIYTFIQVMVPIILVIMGTLDLFKGITASKDDDMKKGQQLFVKRLVAAALIFFVFVIVKVVISVVEDNSAPLINCAECFIKNECGS